MTSKRKGGMLYSIKEDRSSLGKAGSWKRCPCFFVHFSYDRENGRISEFRHLSSKEPLNQHRQGVFNVAMDLTKIIEMSKLNYFSNSRPYRIVGAYLNSKCSERAKEVIGQTIVTYNFKYGFDIQYEVFVVGDAI